MIVASEYARLVLFICLKIISIFNSCISLTE